MFRRKLKQVYSLVLRRCLFYTLLATSSFSFFLLGFCEVGSNLQHFTRRTHSRGGLFYTLPATSSFSFFPLAFVEVGKNLRHFTSRTRKSGDPLFSFKPHKRRVRFFYTLLAAWRLCFLSALGEKKGLPAILTNLGAMVKWVLFFDTLHVEQKWKSRRLHS